MFNGIEVDVVSLGDADCTVVTKWQGYFPHRILIDGGSGNDSETIIDFLRYRNYIHFWAVICTHLHNDHASGLIKIVRNRTISFNHGLMHDITKHMGAGALRWASNADDNVKQVVETTKELAAAFASRGITPLQPFTGMNIAAWPEMTVLGPTLDFYKKVIGEFTDVRLPAPRMPIAVPQFSSALSALAGISLSQSAPASPISPPAPLSLTPFIGALSKSSVKKKPSTQPFNNTSTILGVNFNGAKLLLPADAGSEALAYVPVSWNRLLYMGVPHHGSDNNLSQNDIERFCPQFAFISAKGDSAHPSRAVVSGLVKVGTKVASTHTSGNLWFWSGTVPARTNYEPVEWLRGTGSPEPIDLLKLLLGAR